MIIFTTTHSTLPITLNGLSPLYLFLFSPFSNSLSLISAAHVCIGWGHLLEHGQPTRAQIPKVVATSQQLSSVDPQIGVGTHVPLPHPHWNVGWLDPLQILCSQP